MPIMTGIEAISAIKKVLAKFNKVSEQGTSIVKRPLFCFFSQSNIKTIEQFLLEDEHPDCYLEKPVYKEELTAILKLLNICK